MEKKAKYIGSKLWPEAVGQYLPYIISVVVGLITVVWTWLKGWFSSDYAPLTIPIILAVVGLTFYVANQVRNYRRGRRVDYQELIMKWLFHYQYAVRKVVMDNALWQITATPDVKQPPLNIGVLKADPDFVKIGIGGPLDPEEIEDLAKITSQPQSTLLEELRIEIGRLGIEYKGISHPVKDVYLAQSMALDDSLTRLPFIQTVLRVRQAWILYQNVVVKYQKEHGVISSPILDKEGSKT